MKVCRSIVIVIALTFVARAGAYVSTLTTCNLMLSQLTPPVIELGTSSNAVKDFVRESREERAAIEAEKARLEAEIKELVSKVEEDRKTLKGLDWALDRTIKYPSVDAVPWAKRLKSLRKHLRQNALELEESVTTYEPKLFALLASNSGSKGHYMKRLSDYMKDFTYRIEDLDWVLESLGLIGAQFAIAESGIDPDASLLARGQHVIAVEWSRRQAKDLVKKRMKTILAIRENTKDLAPFSNLDRAPAYVGSSADVAIWIDRLTDARATLKTQHDRIHLKYTTIKSLAEKVNQ